MSLPREIHHARKLEPAAQTALQELAAFVRHMTGAPAKLVADLESPTALSVGPAPGRAPSPGKVGAQGYLLQPTAEGLLIAATSAKGLLNGVYGYLAWSGVKYPQPGVELLPPAGKLRFPGEAVRRSPAFPRSGIFGRGPAGAWTDWCQWYARLGFSELTGTSAEQWPVARKTAERYGMALIQGGHGLSALLPRSEFAAHPDWFREPQPPDFDLTRVPDSNLCVGSKGALDVVRAATKKYVRRYPGTRVHHLWADDLPAGGWCFCARCWGMSAQDQALASTNAVAEAVAAVYPEARTAYLMYHDTLEIPRLVKAHPNINPLWAPRERCYAHALNDPSCPRNRYHAERLEGLLEYLGARDWDLFEYYSDYILFRGMLPLLPEVVVEDLKYYQSLGLGSATHLMVGGQIGLFLNLHIVAQQVWDLGADPWAPLKRLAEGVPGLLEAWKLQAKASRRWTPICSWPMDRYSDYRFLLERPVRETEKYRAGVRQAAEELDRAAGLLPKALPAWAERERVSLKSSAAICREMDAQALMMEELGRCHGGERRGKQAKAAWREALKRAGAAGKVFQRGGMADAYFFGLQPLLEQIWREKVSADYCRE